LAAALGLGVVAVATAVGLTAVERMRAARREVRWLRARLAESQQVLSRQRAESARVAAAVDRLVDATSAVRTQVGVARRLAQVADDAEGAPPPAPQENLGGSPGSSRTLDQIMRVEHHTAVVGDSMALLTALLSQRHSTEEALPSVWPIQGLVTSEFGPRSSPRGGGIEVHPGLDIAAPYGTPVRASGAGEVLFAGTDPGYGQLVILAHGGNVVTMYGHLSSIAVHEHARVQQGDVVGAVGNTGRVTGTHLHFEVRVADEPVDPQRYIGPAPVSAGVAHASRLTVGGAPGIASAARP
jgi:murein DD-endopeptidase MepM/ murein hydrolase activator NlpD